MRNCRPAFLEHSSDDFDAGFLRYRAQVEWLQIRRTRYGSYDQPFFMRFLQPHNDALQRVFSVSAMQIAIGVDKIVAFQADKHAADRDVPDAQALTGWPTPFLDALSWKLGENEKFLAEGEMRGWPLREAPLRDRPLLKIGERHYSFSSGALANTLYRRIRQALIEAEPTYDEPWNHQQTAALESFVFDWCRKKFPAATIYRNAYYKWRRADGTQHTAEADVIVDYGDYLLIVECRAARFTYTSPATDFQAHIRSLKYLVERLSEQSQRLCDALRIQEETILYSSHACKHSDEVGRLRKADIRVIIRCGVTLDAFLGYGARDSWLRTLNIDMGPSPFWSADAVTSSPLKMPMGIGRNETCLCGKKFKHCHGRRRT